MLCTGGRKRESVCERERAGICLQFNKNSFILGADLCFTYSSHVNIHTKSLVCVYCV